MKTVFTTIWLIGMSVLGYSIGVIADFEPVVSIGLAIIFLIVAAIIRWAPRAAGDVAEAVVEILD